MDRYSSRSATIGSTLVARRAGMTVAANATAASSTATEPKVAERERKSGSSLRWLIPPGR
jgi:hypothetical protein